MAVNLASLIMQFFTPDKVAAIASALGLDSDKAQKAIGAGVPAILASLASAAAKPDGGQKLTDILKSAMSDQGQPSPAGGADLLSSVLGGDGLSTLAATVGRFAGIDTNTTKSLLGMLGPFIASVIGKSSAGLDPKGVASLLSSQTEKIAGAMPAGLASQLTDTGLLDGLGDSWRKGAAAASAVGKSVSDISDRASAGAGEMAQAAQSASATRWPYWLAAVVALAAIGWFLPGRNDSQTVAENPPAPGGLMTDRASTSASPPDFRSPTLALALTSSVEAATSALRDISDPTSARVALPKLQKVAAQIDDLSSSVSQLSPADRQRLASVVGRLMPGVNQLCDKILATPQTAELAKPTIDALRTRLQALAES